MFYDELTAEQQTILAASLLDQLNTEDGKGTTWDELANPFAYIDAARVADHYAGVCFTDDDF